VLELKYWIRVPRLTGLRLKNEPSVLQQMVGTLAPAVRGRAQRGEGVAGPLPAPKDGGRAYNRTGQLGASITGSIRQRGERYVGVVRPSGDRRDRDVGAARARARDRTKAMRAAAVLGAALQQLGAGLERTRVRVGRIRARAVDTNAALAAVLSVPPKDPNGIKGGRGVYVVMQPTLAEQNESMNIVNRALLVELMSSGEEVIQG